MSKRGIITEINLARFKVKREIKDYTERLGNIRMKPESLSHYETERMHALEDAIGRFHAQLEYLEKVKSILTFVYDCWLEDF